MKDQEFSRNIETYKSEGFVHIRSVISEEEIGVYTTALEHALKKQDERWADNAYYIDHGMVHNPMIHDDVFLDFLGNTTMLDYLETAFDPNCTLYAFTTSSMPPSGNNFSTRIHVDCPRVIPDYPTNMGFLVALSDFTEENGASYFLPRSHERTDVPGEDEFFADAKRPMLKAGDGVMFNARIWHSGGENATNEFRHALTVNVCRPFMRQRFDYPRMLGDGMLDKLDERLLRFLGYRVRVPVNLEQYYVPPEERLYHSGQG